MARFAELPSDVLDHVLLNLPNFHTLSAALRTSKEFFYNIFQEHTQFIVHAIASNVVGHTLPPAVRLLYYQDHDQICDEASALMVYPLTRSTCASLERNVQIVATLETLFSIMYKDRTSSKSQLTVDEASRFRRAAYRFWLYSDGVLPHDDIEDDESWALEDDTRARYHRQFLAILDAYPTVELFEIDCFALFLRNLVGQTRTASFYGTPDVTEDDFEVEDADIMRSFVALRQEFVRAMWREYPPGIPLASYSEQVRKIYDSRSIPQERRDEIIASAIIDSVNGADDQCCGCGQPKGMNLWNCSNWHLLRYHISPYTLWELIGSRLRKNEFERYCFIRYTMSRHWQYSDDFWVLSFDWNKFLHDIHAMNTNLEEFDPSKWYCKECIMNLLRERLRPWWAALKLQDPRLGMTSSQPNPKGRCWFGHECMKQTVRVAHAERLSHLYDPIPYEKGKKRRQSAEVDDA